MQIHTEFSTNSYSASFERMPKHSLVEPIRPGDALIQNRWLQTCGEALGASNCREVSGRCEQEYIFRPFFRGTASRPCGASRAMVGGAFPGHIQDQEEFKAEEILLEVFTRSGKKNIAATALARKVLCIIYHLLMKCGDYQEPEVKKNKPKIPSCVSPLSMMDIGEMIKTISQAGYLVKKGLKEGCGQSSHPVFLMSFM